MNRDRLAWPMFLLLLTVLVPSVGVVWMMREAVRNERLASNQRLIEAYQIQLQAAVKTIQERWNDSLQRSTHTIDKLNPAAAFEELVSRGNLDSVLIRDSAGKVVYPDQDSHVQVEFAPDDTRWKEAERLEFIGNRCEEAVELYESLALDETTDWARSRARLAQARCLLKLKRQDEAITILQSQRERTNSQNLRSSAAVAELRLIEVLPRESEAWKGVKKSLSDRLCDYQGESFSSSQRLFLMNELKQMEGQSSDLPTFDAETLANQVAILDVVEKATTSLEPTTIPDLWCQASGDGRVIELYRTATVRRKLLSLANHLPMPSGASLAPTAPDDRTVNFVDVSLGSEFGGWRLGMTIRDGEMLDRAYQQRRAIHVWIALLVVVVTCFLAWLLLSSLRQRLRLAQLKNDLVATVSHELKTPLSSIRLLVDTLLESEDDPENQVSRTRSREYLKMISRENTRLTRLIENFLTYSRLQHGQGTVEHEMVDMRRIIREATEVFREHVGNIQDCLFVEDGPPAMVIGDSNALIAAVVNLLENAWKYSDDPRKITVTTNSTEQGVTVAVNDNGIGMSTHAMSQAFDPFFQADQRVARTKGGCGLGLSIVRSIMRAHGGDVNVASSLGSGSTFTLQFPKAQRSGASEVTS